MRSPTDGRRPIAIELSGEPGVREMIALARAAEALGCESVWATETRFTRDAVTAAAAIAAATERIGVGTAVVNPFTRAAALSAVTVATLDELAGGRFIFGVGPGSPSILERQGIAFDRPLLRLREHVLAVRRLLSGDSVTLAGATVRLRDARLDFTPRRPAVPVYLGVTGPKALALAGEIADGVILNGFVSRAYTRQAVAIVRAAEQAHGRVPGSVDIAASLAVSVDEDAARARDAIRPMIATYLAQFPSIANVSGVAPAELARLRDAHEAGGSLAAARLVTDDVVAELACAGTTEECLTAIERRREAGVRLPMLSVVHGDALVLLARAAS